MLTTTFRLAREGRACKDSYKRFARHVLGVKKYGENTPIPLTEIVDVCGLEDALWCLRITNAPELAIKAAVSLASDFAERVLPIFERAYPDDTRPRDAIRLIRQYLETGNKDAARDAADAAWDAADAAWAAADTAWAAAYAARAAASAARDAAEAARAAAYAARAAAYAVRAAADAAWAAADAARAAEREWQLQRFKEVIHGLELDTGSEPGPP